MEQKSFQELNLNNAILFSATLKKDRNLEERYMRLEEEYKLREKEGHKKGKEEGIKEIFSLMNAMKHNNEEHLIPLLSDDQNFYEAKLKEYHL